MKQLAHFLKKKNLDLQVKFAEVPFPFLPILPKGTEEVRQKAIINFYPLPEVHCLSWKHNYILQGNCNLFLLKKFLP